jgi:hypothetical protein
MKTTASALGSLAVAVAASFAAPTVLADDDVFVQVAQLRKATAHLRSIDNAATAGYAAFLGCVSEPGEGAMGVHFLNDKLVGDPTIDALRPEALMFEPGRDGRMKLVGVEYIVFQEAWDAEHAVPPMLFGEHFHLVTSPNRYGVPAFYALHAWVWRHNPVGMFHDWNPRVSCDDHGAIAPIRHAH